MALSLTDNVLRVSISDNGRGDGKVSARSESFGFQNIMHRASLIGARVEWLKPEQYSSGTMLVLTVPCTTGGSESFSVKSSFGAPPDRIEGENEVRADHEGEEET